MIRVERGSLFELHRREGGFMDNCRAISFKSSFIYKNIGKLHKTLPGNTSKEGYSSKEGKCARIHPVQKVVVDPKDVNKYSAKYPPIETTNEKHWDNQSTGNMST